jgi:oligopeptide transport system permease protein
VTFLLRRLLLFVPTLWAILTLSFLLVHAARGGPFQSEKEIPASARAQLMHTYGLDRPLLEQYGRFLASAVRGDLGPSYKYPQRQVRDLVAEGFRVSAELGGLALLLALLMGVPLGTFAASRHGRLGDHAAMAVALAGVAVPNFVLGPLLVLVFSLGLYWLPPALWNGPASRVLPVVTLAAAYAAYIARLTRAGMLEVLGQDFIRSARA